MNEKLRRDAGQIIDKSLKAVLPDEAVARDLDSFQRGKGQLVLVSVGKAAWQMASAALARLGKVDRGIVITKYGHS